MLPDVSASQQELSHQLQNIIKDKIVSEGPITFAKFMDLALYHHSYGYYRNGSIKFGADGDFVTAPEISPFFSHCLARQFDVVWSINPEYCVLELGAGSGQMALDVLLALEKECRLPKKYFILEVSADLVDRQQALLKEKASHLVARVEWITVWPSEFHGVILANEVLDAMPVNKFIWDQGFYERYVGLADGKLVWSQGELSSSRLRQALLSLPIPKISRYESEINLSLEGWIQSISRCLASGIIFLIDYGYSVSEYYHPVRSQGTVMCHYRHHAHSDPFWYPGVQDITSFVNFTSVAEAATSSGLDVLGYIEQGRFLVNSGIYDMLPDTNIEMQYSAAQRVKRLTLPTEMGERFKLIALGRGVEDDMLGFAEGDQLYRL